MKYFWKDIFKLIPAIIVSIVIGAFAARIIVVNTIMHFIMVGFIYVIAYSLLMYCMGLNTYEKNLIGKLVNRVLRRS